MLQEVGDSPLRPKIIYHPSGEANQISKFRRFVEHKCNFELKDYWELHKWSCKNYPEFWECVWQYFGILHSTPYTEVFDRRRSFDNMEWFKGALMNYTENIFKHRDSQTALIALDSKDNMESFTYKEMYDEVCVYAAALKDLGVKKGDAVACYAANKVELVFAFLACASMGVLWCGSLPLLGSKSTIARFEQIHPKVIFTSGNFSFEGKEINMIEKLKTIALGLPLLEKVVIVPINAPIAEEDIDSIPKCCTIAGFLSGARSRYQNAPWDLEFEQVPFDYPLTISFTSGTTGMPKGLIHSHGSFFASLKDYALHQNITRKDVLINFSPAGWISWIMYTNCLHLGMTLCMYEGMPFMESPTRFWDLIDKLKITSSYIWSSTADEMETNGYLPTESHSLDSLKQLFPMGSIVKPKTYEFISRIKPGIFVDSLYGTTEVFGLISGLDSNLPIYKGELQCFSLGMEVKCLDSKGKEVINERGCLVLANPYPAMPISLLHDDSKQIVREMYLDRYPGYWNVSDEMWINPVTKGFVLYGRMDDTLNPQGARFTSSDIYFALQDFESIYDCVCVPQFNQNREERVVLFVRMKPGYTLDQPTKEEIRKVIEDSLTFEHVPEIIMEVSDIPYNLTGKKMGSVVKKLINQVLVPNEDLIINPSSLDFYKQVDLGNF